MATKGFGQIRSDTFAPAPTEVRNVIGGLFEQNTTLLFRNGPFRADRDIIVESGITLTIETGVRIYFDPGKGMTVRGNIYAVVSLLH